jgi:hypothetical protein
MRFRRLVALLVVMACTTHLQPGLRAVASAGGQAPGAQQPTIAAGLRISGTVLREIDRSTVADVNLRLRNVNTGTIVGRTVSDRNGAFSFVVPEPGLYVVEALDKGLNLQAVSSAVNSTTAPLTTDVILPQEKTTVFSSSAILILTAAAGVGTGLWIIASGGGNVSSPER